MKKNLIYYMFGMLFLLGACYDDKGNYDYSEINEIIVNLPELYSLRLTDTTIVIRPEISQSLHNQKDNLTYTWQCSNSSFSTAANADTISFADTVAIHINPEAEEIAYNYYLRFNVYDHEYGIMHPYQTQIQISKPYQGAWMILHKQDGESRLGTVEYIGMERYATNDVYYPANGKKLQGEPIAITCHDYASANFLENVEPLGYPVWGYDILMIVTDNPKESGMYNYLDHFNQWISIEDLLSLDIRYTFDFSKVSLLQGEGFTTICISDGVLYQGNQGCKLYKILTDDDVTGDIDITCGTMCGFTPVFFDQAGRRFLYFNQNANSGDPDPTYFDATTENAAKLSLIPNRPDNVQYGTVDPTKIPADQEVLYLGQGFQYDPTISYGISCYAFAKGSNNQSYIYEFRSSGIYNNRDKAFAGYYTINTPDGIDENTCFASNIAYNGILFYSIGSQIYRLDFTQTSGSSSLVYSHGNGKITGMKFAKPNIFAGKDTYPEYIYNPNQELGVIVDNGDGTSDFVILELSTAGKADAIHEYKDQFGKIKDIAYL